MALASKIVTMALMVPGIVMADLCTTSDICTYSVVGTGLNTSVAPPTEDTTTTWNLTFQFLGPEMNNAAPNTLLGFSVTGTPAAGWVYDNSLSGLRSYNGTDGDAIVTLDDPTAPGDGLGVASVTYTFYGTDGFWATTGSNTSFGATNDPTATSGAFFTFTDDPPCTACSVSITGTPVVPEPATGVLLGMVAGISLYFLGRRQKQPA